MNQPTLRNASASSLALGCALLLAACNSGGGGLGGGGTGGGGNNGNTSGFRTTLLNPSSLGTNATPMHQATAAADNLDSTVVGDVFPLVQTAADYALDGFGPNAAANTGGANIGIVSMGANGPDRIALSLPGLGVTGLELAYNAAQDNFATTTGGNTYTVAWRRQVAGMNLDYTALGTWEVAATSALEPGWQGGFFYSGYETPAAPTTGTAAYSGAAYAFYVGANGNNAGTAVGTSALNVDFATGGVAGSMTAMSGQYANGSALNLNDINLSGNIDGTNTFSGAATVVAGSNGPLGHNGSGTFNGRLFGDIAQEAAWTWSVRDNDGNLAAGVAGGKQ